MDTSFKTKNPIAEGIEIIQLLNNCGSSKSRLLLSSRLRIRGNRYFFIQCFSLEIMVFLGIILAIGLEGVST